MEQIPTILVNTKNTVPRQRSGAIHRQRLFEGVNVQDDVNVYLVHAPAGYGKTTLLLDWLAWFRQQGAYVSWYALDEKDNDKTTFALYFLNCLFLLDCETEYESLIQRIRSMTDVNLVWLMKSVINFLSNSERTHVIVLDDYQCIENNEIHEALAYFLEYLPDAVKVIVSTRKIPPFPIARWQVRARLCEIGPEDLKFQFAEVQQFLSSVMNLQLASDVVALIAEQTEGWAAGLQLSAIMLAGRNDPIIALRSFTGNHQLLMTYLIEEVFDHLPEKIQIFLLETSIFPRFCVEMCNTVLSYPESSSEMIAYIEREHLFLVELDDSHLWFRYHHLFSSFLQSKLEKEYPGKKQALHHRASLWFKEKQYYREAVQQAFFSEDWQYAADLVCELGFYMIIHSEISLLYEWTIAFPEEMLQANPLLCILQSWALVYRYRKQNRLHIEARLHQAEQAIANMDEPEQIENLTEHLAVVRTFLAMAPDPGVNVQAYLNRAKQMLGPYPAGHPGQYSALLTSGYAYLALPDVERATDALEKARRTAFDGQLYFGFIEATFHLARLMYSVGKLEEAKELCQSGKVEVKVILPNAEQVLPALGSLDIVLGAILVEENKLEEALIALQHGRDLIGSGSNPYYLFVTYHALIKHSLYNGNTQQAYEYMQELNEFWPDVSFYTQGMNFIAHSYEGKLDGYVNEAKIWCDNVAQIFTEHPFLPGMGPLGGAEIYYETMVCWFRISVLLGQFDKIKYLWQQMKLQSKTQNLLQRILDLDIIAVLATWWAGEKNEAVYLLDDLVRTVNAHGFCQVINLGKPLLEIISYMEAGWKDTDIPSCLLQIKRQVSRNIPGIFQRISERERRIVEFIEPLSERELELMKLIARGMDNQQIADTLFITVGTVKSHINHILRKLSAKNRTEAVDIVRQHGIEL